MRLRWTSVDRVRECFFIFDQGEVLWSTFLEAEKLLLRSPPLGVMDALFHEASRCRKTPFIGMWPDLVKPFFGYRGQCLDRTPFYHEAPGSCQELQQQNLFRD